MIVYALVVWFGIGNTQTSFAISGIANDVECERLANEMRHHYGRMAEAKCYPYRGAR